MGGPSTHLAADPTKTIALEDQERKSMPAPAGGAGGKPRRRAAFESNDSTLNGDYRRPRRRLRKRYRHNTEKKNKPHFGTN